VQYELIANTPVDDGVIKAWHGCLVKAPALPVSDEDRANAALQQAGALEAFATDFQIWRHKKPALKIMQLKTDGPFRTGRKWYSQFYLPRAEAAALHSETNGIYHVQGMPTPSDKGHAIDDDLPI
jgi:3-ketosteroid 9alpha-monooxygenase subunit A